ncbi:MAG: sulfate transporter [Alphaproteobacteria bacterium HGW-Alphaproteobacteria-2]|nr:MAG: sulfate transporter [Alphaproteobacteria bacterium HGW-Alphaproteobacteria-2]
MPDGRVELHGKAYMPDARGNLVPVELIRPAVLLEDEVVRKVVGYAEVLSAQVARFKGHTFEDLGALDALLAQEYDLTKGGAKGNKTYQTHDGLMKVQVQVADYIDFGPQLQIAKALVDECLNEWSEDARPEIRAIVTRAFNTDKEGQINRSEIFMLLRLAIEDPRWLKAMEAIRDAMRIVGTKIYVRVYRRETPDGAWRAVTIDLAKA